MVQFCYLRLYLGTENLSCLLMQRMTRMVMDWNLKTLEYLFSSFNAMPAKITQKYNTVDSAP